MGTLAYSEYPDEILHNTAFHQGLHYLRQNDLMRKTYIIWKLKPAIPQYIQWTFPGLLYETKRKNLLIGMQRLTKTKTQWINNSPQTFLQPISIGMLVEIIINPASR